jgi:hypothetical protein
MKRLEFQARGPERLDLVPFRLLIDYVPNVARRFVGSYFWPTAVPLLVVGVVAAFAQFHWMKSFLDPQTMASGNPFALMAPFFLFMLAAFAIYIQAYLALAVLAVDAVAGRPVSMSRAWRFCMRPTVLGTNVVVGLLVAVSTLMCCVPGLVVAPLLALIIPVMVEEGSVGLGAMSRTVELVRFQGRRGLADSGWAQAFLVLFVGAILSYAASMVTQGPFVLVQQALLIRQTAGGQVADPSAVLGNLWLQVPAQVLGALVTELVWAYWAFGLALLYFETRRRKEAADLEQAITALVTSP